MYRSDWVLLVLLDQSKNLLQWWCGHLDTNNFVGVRHEMFTKLYTLVRD